MRFHNRLDIAYRRVIDQKLKINPVARDTDAGRLQSLISFIGLSKVRGQLMGVTTHANLDFDMFRTILEKARSLVNHGVVRWFCYLPTSEHFAPEQFQRTLPAIDPKGSSNGKGARYRLS